MKSVHYMCTMCEYVYKVQLFLFVLVLLYYFFQKKILLGIPAEKNLVKIVVIFCLTIYIYMLQ